ncbi:PhzF family phenazine biosynthesis protein [Chengkuizengella axinellae]|uniref:PhzF family phenazine biosynthesis protein n=1 Tax=Chengkuizengella axinellae TaxID=3064388 RepID=A0ABT9IXT6_9BACL|nr:PhzF family phenazine biosynthesis protein [Chengkuizengella sp. 2205SS18-9]MDP5273932.1 PhzF family phenazine biosynthesis protein [Chengkuizengella sp. 2205SS18-9]
MRKVRVYHVDAFTKEQFGGNPAGVVLGADSLSMNEMQKVANELNLSETAFLYKTENAEADFRVRYFTPTNEINFCGHATIGLSWLLASNLGWTKKKDRIVLDTNIGLVPVKWHKDGELVTAVEMTQVAPKVNDFNIERSKIAEILGVHENDIDKRYPIKIANTGNWHLLIPIIDQKAIDAAKPNFEKLARLNQIHNVDTTHLFTFTPEEQEYDLYTRDFLPALGVNEDPVTGAANGALSGYLVLENILDPTIKHTLKIAQGHTMGRPGMLYVTVEPGKTHPIIKVAGSAVVTIEGTLNLQPSSSKENLALSESFHISR